MEQPLRYLNQIEGINYRGLLREMRADKMSQQSEPHSGSFSAHVYN